MTTSHSSIPTRKSSVSEPRPIPAAPTEKPTGSDTFGRIELAPGIWGYTCACGCGASMTPEYARVPGFDDMRDRQSSRVGLTDLWKHAFNPACVREERTFPLLATHAQIEKTEAETSRRQAEYRAEQERLASIRRQADARRIKEKRMTEGTGKTAGERAKHPNESWRNRPEASQARTARSLGELGSLFGDLPGDRKVA